MLFLSHKFLRNERSERSEVEGEGEGEGKIVVHREIKVIFNELSISSCKSLSCMKDYLETFQFEPSCFVNNCFTLTPSRSSIASGV